MRRRFLTTLGVVTLLGLGSVPASAGIIVTVGKIDCEDGRTQAKRVGDSAPAPNATPTSTPPSSMTPPQAPPAAPPGACPGDGPRDGKASGSCAMQTDGQTRAGRGGSAGAGAGGTAEAGPIDQGDEIAVMGCEAGGGAGAPVAFGLGILAVFGLRRRVTAR
ncbi:MAG: hypothetical protein H6745_11910 [Deltaproteobacteria bacterium]|nr:hypothetical protein [Deltaproteobacteria bacterium]